MSKASSCVRWILCELERFPTAVFSELDLRLRFGQGFKDVALGKILKRLPPLQAGDRYRSEGGRVLTVVQTSRGIEAVDDEDAEAEPITIRQRQAGRYQVELPAVAALLGAANGLVGEPDVLAERFIFAGEARRDDFSLAVVLALLSGDGSAVDGLRGLPHLLPSRYDRVVLACPSFVPSPSCEGEMESLGLAFCRLPEDGSFRVDYTPAASQRPRPMPRTMLTPEEESSFERYQFKSRVAIILTGRRERRKGNLVEVAGRPVVLTDAPFRIFLRLVLGLFETEHGWLSMPEIRGAWMSREVVETGEVLGYELDQAISRLRMPFRPCLGHLRPTDFIQRERGLLRLSTHRRFINIRRDLLLEHPDAFVRQVAAGLPDKETRQSRPQASA